MMASGQVDALPRAANPLVNGRASPDGEAPRADDGFEMQQYLKIIELRNKVLEGSHPKIKLPAHLADKVAAFGRAPSPNLQPLPRPLHQQRDRQADQSGNPHSFPANSLHDPAAALMPGPPHAVGFGATVQQATSRTAMFARGNTEINPIFLEKSESLIKAEFGLQRQRLERGLREALEEKIASGKANKSTVDPLSSFEIDVADVFERAKALADATLPVTTGQTNNTADPDTSFDENDYYSSRHDTPESRENVPSSDGEVTADAPNASSKDVPAPTQPRPAGPNQTAPAPNTTFSIPGLQSAGQYYHGIFPNMLQPPFQRQAVSAAASAQLAPSPAQRPTTSANNSVVGDALQVDSTSREGHDTRGNSSQESGEASRSEGGVVVHAMHQRVWAAGQQMAAAEDSQAQRAPPLVRAHDLSPIAPQPSHVSTLAVAGRHLGGNADLNISQGAPAQVAALRNEASGKSSPDSSSPQAKAAKKKEKKKKRKAERLAQETSTTPHIKTEPHSPSPFAAPPMPRPSKRQRQAQRQQDAAAAEAPRFEQPGASANRPRYQTRSQRKDQPPVTYATQDRQGETYFQRPEVEGIPGPETYDRSYITQPPPPQVHYEPEAPPQRNYSAHYTGDDYVRPVSQAPPPRHYRESAQYYPTEYGPVHIGRPEEEHMRPGSPIMMGPPRAPLQRVLVDASGREYFEPQRPHVVRQSVAPSARPGEPEVIYEQRSAPVRHSIAPQTRLGEPEVIYERSAPVRSASKRPPVYEDGGAVYREDPSPYGFPRRVVTQPELPLQAQGYGQRDYSARPMVHASDEHNHFERRSLAEAPREYITRSASVRPAEPVRYEMAREPGNRVQSVRPEPLVREYGTSLHTENRVEMGPPLGPGYGRPAEPHAVQRPYSVRPQERYYERPGPPVGGDEVAYMGERPHVPQDVVYVEGPRGDVYR